MYSFAVAAIVKIHHNKTPFQTVVIGYYKIMDEQTSYVNNDAMNNRDIVEV